LTTAVPDTPLNAGRSHTLRDLCLLVDVLVLFATACAPIMQTPLDDALELNANELIAWIAANTRYPIVKPPKIKIVATLPNSRINFGGKSLIAAYNYDTQILYLKQRWSGEIPQDKGTLLHELLHHAQVVSGIGPTCIREREIEAYATELSYLRENHSNDWDWSPGLKATLLAVPCN
jgi:hypothetical protein